MKKKRLLAICCYFLVSISGCHPLVGVLAVAGAYAIASQQHRPTEQPSRSQHQRSPSFKEWDQRNRFGVITAAEMPSQARQIADTYDACEYEECERLAEAEIQGRFTPAGDRATAWFYKGAVLVLKNREREATECFREVRRLAPQYWVDKQRFKPAVIACFEASRS